jgi:hypothetical protein
MDRAAKLERQNAGCQVLTVAISPSGRPDVYMSEAFRASGMSDELLNCILAYMEKGLTEEQRAVYSKHKRGRRSSASAASFAQWQKEQESQFAAPALESSPHDQQAQPTDTYRYEPQLQQQQQPLSSVFEPASDRSCASLSPFSDETMSVSSGASSLASAMSLWELGSVASSLSSSSSSSASSSSSSSSSTATRKSSRKRSRGGSWSTGSKSSAAAVAAAAAAAASSDEDEDDDEDCECPHTRKIVHMLASRGKGYFRDVKAQALDRVISGELCFDDFTSSRLPLVGIMSSSQQQQQQQQGSKVQNNRDVRFGT